MNRYMIVIVYELSIKYSWNFEFNDPRQPFHDRTEQLQWIVRSTLAGELQKKRYGNKARELDKLESEAEGKLAKFSWKKIKSVKGFFFLGNFVRRTFGRKMKR